MSLLRSLSIQIIKTVSDKITETKEMFNMDDDESGHYELIHYENPELTENNLQKLGDVVFDFT